LRVRSLARQAHDAVVWLNASSFAGILAGAVVAQILRRSGLPPGFVSKSRPVNQLRPPLLPLATIIPGTNGQEANFRCLLALAEQSRGEIVVEGDRTNDARATLQHMEGIRGIRTEKDEAFARACTQSASAANREVLVPRGPAMPITSTTWPAPILPPTPISFQPAPSRCSTRARARHAASSKGYSRTFPAMAALAPPLGRFRVRAPACSAGRRSRGSGQSSRTCRPRVRSARLAYSPLAVTPRPWAVLLDGTLVDSVPLMLTSVRHAFNRSHRPTDTEWSAGIGVQLHVMLRPWSESGAGLDALVQRYRAHQLKNHDQKGRPFPGAPEAVRTLRDRGHPIGIVSGKTSEGIQRTLRHVGLTSDIDDIVAADDCPRHKPDPTPEFLALKRLDREPGHALLMGDTVVDIAAGNAAGVVTIAVTWGTCTRETLAAGRPTHLLDDPAGSPEFVARMCCGREATHQKERLEP